MDLEKHPAAPAPAPAGLRASDADRDRIAQILGDAVAEGRLTAEEHSERLDTLYAVKTVGELEALVRDLPAPAGAHAPSSYTGAAGPAAETIVAVCSSSSRKGRWRPGAHTRAVSVMGDITIDLTQAVFEQQVTEINVTCVLGNVEVLVPENVTLRGYGSGVLGNFEVRGMSRGETDPQAPVVIVRGFSLLGNIEARPKLGARLVDLARKLRKNLDG
ncbi:DUF1707 SHOCT-like domain-containing protein [Streptomyces virginiae]|uniref:Cell wall-active antibiotics response LiaF-like C-terminal domain-containing protein n=1 Tax=Streptomyces virginiae TaxID=1961 RepID=A0ABQ3NDQ9_STRVG|nr:DUF1707 domain-containing protein [Streptomyces virginiae]MBP2346247.1 hypothetical protein [Streptomyces virginiae]GGQ13655.1 hypothetical protein GCM10010215_43220 [Streptomyces virginiae]GHI10933.1 hypothetical protein Scinn_03960 [Streptomyces virginiae]